jgi:hypothetical protein
MKIIDGLLFLSVDEMVSHGIQRGTIHNGISQYRNHKTHQWLHMGEKEGTEYYKNPLIAYEFLPSQTKSKLPAKRELLKIALEEAELTKRIAEISSK